MAILYDAGLFFFHSAIRIAALFGNKKAKLWVSGRNNWESNLRIKLEKAGKKRVWFHCASLGEFEQGRPLIEKLKSEDSELFILLTFFSPSGFEIRKDYKYADAIFYLPADSHTNAKKFVEISKPLYAVFVKYEYWFHFFSALKRKNIPLYIVSGIFRPSQIFFKSYGAFYKKVLSNVSHFFLQDEHSSTLLKNIGFENTTVTGDTRFDRVKSVRDQAKSIPELESFKGNTTLIIAGSTWPEDENILFESLANAGDKNLKLVIAPHETDAVRIEKLIKVAGKYYDKKEIVRFTQYDSQNASVLIVDKIGLLSSIYRYGSIAWIGGGFTKGIHNILEAAVFGIPVLFGPNYEKFREAVDLVRLKGAFSVVDFREASKIIKLLYENHDKLLESGISASSYVNSQTGATEKILATLKKTI